MISECVKYDPEKDEKKQKFLSLQLSFLSFGLRSNESTTFFFFCNKNKDILQKDVFYNYFMIELTSDHYCVQPPLDGNITCKIEFEGKLKSTTTFESSRCLP